MSKKNESPVTIEAGKPIRIEAATRAEAVQKIADLRKQASEQGLTEGAGGFIEFSQPDTAVPGVFTATVIFN